MADIKTDNVLNINPTFKNSNYAFLFPFSIVPLRSRLERKSSKQEAMGSSLTVGKNFSFCNCRFLHVLQSLTKQLRMESSVTYT